MTTIIICSPDAAKFQKTAEMYSRFWPRDQLQVFHIPDARSLAEAYNRGIRAAGGDTIIFSHDDIEIVSPDLAQRLTVHLCRFDIVGVAGTTLLGHPRWLQAGPPYIFGQVAHTIPEGGYMVDIYGASRRVFGQIQALDGLFLAVKAPIARELMFDEQTFDGFHCYDVDFTFRAYQAGYKLAVACDIQVVHEIHRKARDPPVTPAPQRVQLGLGEG
jgi:GT2 family glycosyltransferase